MDVAEGVKEKTSKLMWMKKLIQTYIPTGETKIQNNFLVSNFPKFTRFLDHGDSSQIKDTYKVFVCQRKMYLDPFIQENLRDYNKPCCYSVCTLGHKVGSSYNCNAP